MSPTLSNGDCHELSPRPPLVLASASPRRRELLAILQVDFIVCPADIEESLDGGKSLVEAVADLSERKAQAVARDAIGHVILGADTIVVCDGQVLGKPVDAEDACRMLRALAGQWHEVITGIALVDRRSGNVVQEAMTTRVLMHDVSDAEISAYVATGEPMDKAGSYAIQGQGGRFVRQIEGCYTNVVGLPMCVTADLLRGAGLPLADVDVACRTLSGDPCPQLMPSRRGPT